MKEQWAYAGRRISSDGTVAFVWFQVIAGAISKDPLIFTKLRGVQVGTIYDVEVDRSEGKPLTVIHKGGGAPRYHGSCQETELVRGWALEDEQARQDVEVQRYEAKAEDPLDVALEPLLRLWRKTNGVGRNTLLTMVVRKLMRAERF